MLDTSCGAASCQLLRRTLGFSGTLGSLLCLLPHVNSDRVQSYLLHWPACLTLRSQSGSNQLGGGVVQAVKLDSADGRLLV